MRLTAEGRPLRRGGVPATTTTTRVVGRDVHVRDALEWVREREESDGGILPRGSCVVASLPDISEYISSSSGPDSGVDAYSEWLVDTVARLLRLLPRDGVAVFCQSDIIASEKGQRVGYVDKGALVGSAAAGAGSAVLWHKVACRHAPGTPRNQVSRPVYSHLMAYASPRLSREDVASRFFGPAAARAFPQTADVLESRGDTLWTRGMGYEATLLASRFCVASVRAARLEEGQGGILDEDVAPTVYNPFSGEGTVLAVANAIGAHAVGIELSRKRADKSRKAVVL